MLPMFPSANQGRGFYNPDLPQTEPFVPVTGRAPAAGRPSSTG